MNGKWTASALVSVCVAVAVGCAAPVDGPADTASAGATSQAAVVSPIPVKGPVGGGGKTTPPESTVPVACQRIAPVNVIRLVDKEGLPTYSDGYTVPFPTPGAEEAAKEDVNELPVYKYEQALNGISAINRYEWRVHVIVLSSEQIKSEDMHEYFVVGIPDATSANEAKALLAQTPEWTTKPVDAEILHCVHVWDRSPSGKGVQELPKPTWFVYADEHDPSTHPT